jgi:ribosomal protein S18 acetylase RimI-like enzyme
MKSIYREMNIYDLPEVFLVRLSTRENNVTITELEEDYGITPESVAEAMKTNVKGWVCEVSKKVVGFSMGNRTTGEVEVIAVLPDYEGRDIGKKLLSLAQEWLFASGQKEIWLYSNPDPDTRAYGFYRRLGWKSTG